GAVFLRAQSQLAVAQVQVRFQYPPMAVEALFAEQKRMRPQAAMAIVGQRRLRLADGFADPVRGATQANAAGCGVLADQFGVAAFHGRSRYEGRGSGVSEVHSGS